MSACFPAVLFGAFSCLLGLWCQTKQDSRLKEMSRSHGAAHALASTMRRLEPRLPAIALALGLGLLAVRPVTSRSVSLVLSAAPLACLAWLVVVRWRRARWLAAVTGEWPVLLETMAVGAMSGFDLNSAFAAAARRVSGPLADEVDKVVLRLASGSRLSRALDLLVDRGVPGAERMSSALFQCEVLGTPIAGVLDALASESASLQRQELEARFNSLPLKMSIVTVVFLLPPLLVVSVVPHVLVFLNSQW